MEIVLARNLDGIFVSSSEEIEEVLKDGNDMLIVDNNGNYHHLDNITENMFIGSKQVYK